MKFAFVIDGKIVEYRDYDAAPICKVINGEKTIRPVEELVPPEYNTVTDSIERTETITPEKVIIGWNIVARQPADVLASMKEHAQSALDESDRVAIRCAKAGIQYPSAWLAYDELLRAIMRATVEGGVLTELPPRPNYPTGT